MSDNNFDLEVVEITWGSSSASPSIVIVRVIRTAWLLLELVSSGLKSQVFNSGGSGLWLYLLSIPSSSSISLWYKVNTEDDFIPLLSYLYAYALKLTECPPSGRENDLPVVMAEFHLPKFFYLLFGWLCSLAGIKYNSSFLYVRTGLHHPTCSLNKSCVSLTRPCKWYRTIPHKIMFP